MSRLPSHQRIFKVLTAAAGGWLGLASYALAAAKEVEEKSSKGGDGGSWTLSYGIVMLVLGLGLLLVLKATGRRERAKPEQPSA